MIPGGATSGDVAQRRVIDDLRRQANERRYRLAAPLKVPTSGDIQDVIATLWHVAADDRIRSRVHHDGVLIHISAFALVAAEQVEELLVELAELRLMLRHQVELNRELEAEIERYGRASGR